MVLFRMGGTLDRHCGPHSWSELLEQDGFAYATLRVQSAQRTMAAAELRLARDVEPCRSAPSAADRSPLRVGILIDDYIQERWVAAIIQEILDSDFAEIVLVMRNAARPPRRRRSLLSLVRSVSQVGLYRLYLALDELVFRREPDPFAPVDMAAILDRVPTIAVEPRSTRFCDYFDDVAIEQIRSYNLDVALRLGFRILKGRSLEIARCGVWSYHHGDNLLYRSGPPGFWEVVEDNPVTGSVLQILNEELDNGQVIFRAHYATDRMSVWRNRQNYYWKSATFVTRMLRALHRLGPRVLVDPMGAHITPYSRQLYRLPTNAQMVWFITRLAARYATHFSRTRRRTLQWFIAYKLRQREAAPDAPPDTTLYNFRRLIPPAGCQWADPFPVRVDGADVIFFEEIRREAHGRGRIACVEVNAAGTVGPPSVVLEQDYHLSYPHVFRWNDSLYMIPETWENGRVELYRCVSFPDRWERAAVLLDHVEAVDTTVIHWEGRWWMFLAMTETPTQASSVIWKTSRTSRAEDLHIFHADDLHGPWQPHARNPVKSDVRSVRPAGRPFVHNGRLFRPAQDGSRVYGRAIVIHEVRRLDPDHFEEVQTSSIEPDWAPRLVGTHTINGSEGLTAIDGRRVV